MGKGWLDRVKSGWERVEDIAGGAAGVLDGSVDIVLDVAMSPIRDDEYDNFWEAVTGAFGRRGGQILESAIGPEKGLGAVIGGLPEVSFRRPVNAALSGLETVYREGVSEPLSTLVTVASKASKPDDGFLGDWGEFFKGSTWRDSYRIAQDRGPGQAIAAALLTDDIDDVAKVDAAIASPAGQVVSGTFDALIRFKLDPTVAVGKVVGVARRTYIAEGGLRSTAIRNLDDVAAAASSNRANRFLERIDEIKQRFGGETGRSYSVEQVVSGQNYSASDLLEDLDVNGRNGDVVFSLENVDPRSLRSGLDHAAVDDFPDVAPEYLNRLVDAYKRGDDVRPIVVVDGGIFDGRHRAWAAAQAGVDVPAYVARPRSASGLAPRSSVEAAAKVRDELFPTHTFGGQVSTVLVEAPDLNAQRLTLRALMGETAALDELTAGVPAQAHMIRNLMRGADETLAREAGQAALDAPVDVLMEGVDVLARWDDAFHALDTVPRATRASQARSAISRSEFYQRNPLTAPVRTVTNMRPQHWLDLNDQRSDIQIARIMQKAKLPEETQLALRGEYMRATTAAQRQQVAIRIENEVTAHILGARGVSREAADQIIRLGNDERAGALGALRNRVYDAKGRGVVTHVDVDGTVERIALPLHVTQQADLFPLVNIDELEKAAVAAQRQGWTRFRAGVRETDAGFVPGSSLGPRLDYPTDALEAFYRLWRPATLLRVGWPARILADEQLRMIAEIGGLSGYGRTGLTEIADRMGSSVARRVPGLRNAGRVGREAVEQRAVGRYAGREVRGVAMPGPFEGPGGQVALQRNSSAGTFREVQAGEVGQDLLAGLRQHTGQWKVIGPSPNPALEAEHLRVWADVLNRQIKQSAFARVFLEGGTVDDGVRWLNSPAGVAYAREIGWAPTEFAARADDVFDQIQRYAPAGVREELLAKDLDAGDLARLVDDIDSRPLVHGEELAQALGVSQLWKDTKKIVASGWENFGRVPTDVMSRNPFFAAMYDREVARLVGLLQSQADLTPQSIERIAQSARKKALNASQQVLYDLAEKSEFAHILRFISPFYMAWQEVITRWASLGAKNPAFAARARLAWNAPEKAGLVQDENGYRIDENGVPHDPFTDAALSKDLAGSDRYITLPVAIPGLPTGGPIRFNKRGFNLALTGSPGVGPAVQVPVNEIIKDRPELADSVKFILPFGSTQETLSLLLPATAKRAFALAQGDENRLFTNDLGRIYTTKMTDFLLDKRDEPPTYEEVLRDTQRFYQLRTFISWVSPVAPTFDSPYQPYINAYRNAQALLRDDEFALGTNEDGTAVTVDDWFLDTYGEEYFWLTTTFTRAQDGVPPTLEGFEGRQKYEDLIEEYPELGGLIIGSEGAGDFARGVYDSQLANAIKPGDADMQREALVFEDFERDPEIRLGWLKYGRYMDLLDAELHRRGLPSYNVAPARDLRDQKSQIIEQLEAKYPEWSDEFRQTDGNAWKNRIKGMRAIAADERLAQRPDIQGLGLYLKYRDLVMAELAARESSTLSAVSNQDLAFQWDSIRTQIIERNPAFSSTYYRYLERDPMEGD